MKRWVCLLSVACILALCWGVAEARENPNAHQGQVAEPPEVANMPAVTSAFFNDLNIGAMWFPSIRNKGYIGYADLSAWYPGGGDQSDLWQAGMWAGGYVKSPTMPGGFQPKAWRYLGSDGATGDLQYDLVDAQAVVKTEANMSFHYPYRSLTCHVNTADKPFSTSAGDTVDGDLGIDVKYEWQQWGVRGYDNWVFCHVTIVFSKPVKDFFFGWMTDSDCGNVNLADYYYDDYVGFNTDLKFCYMRDWDYDPLPGQIEAATTADSLFLSTNAIGQFLMAGPPIGGRANAAAVNTTRWQTANFWDWNNDISSVQDTYDRIAGIWTNPFPPAVQFDYRMLNGVGPYQAEAGDTAHFWMAYVMGEGYNDDNHSTYGLGNLVQHVKDAEAFFNGGMVIPASAYPPVAPNLNPALIDIHAVDVSADELTVHWAPYTNIPPPGAHADSFFVFANTISKTGPWERVAGFGSGATSTTVKLIPGFYTYVMVQAYDATTGTISNPWAMTGRLYETDSRGRLRANNNTIVNVIGNTAAESALDQISVAPNPYDGSNPAELREFETLLGFHHLPAKCTIYIYTMLGNLVDIIHHDSDSGSEFWDMTTRSNESISSGMYVYRVHDLKTGEEKLGKFAVIKGQR
jgi:hypothetical protein